MAKAAIPGIGDPDDLKRWFRESGRAYIVLFADDLIDALPWPEGAEQLMRIISAYRAHRGQSDVLEPEEIREAIAFLKQQLPA
jgi:hypothetical protein